MNPSLPLVGPPAVGPRPAEPLLAGTGSRPGAPARIALAVLGFYRVAISPLRPPSCRYLPSCSEYAVDAVRAWGLVRGSWMALCRLARCHPWHAGGHDPVPPRPEVAQRLASPLSPAAG